jgi:hypothetical protein
VASSLGAVLLPLLVVSIVSYPVVTAAVAAGAFVGVTCHDVAARR